VRIFDRMFADNRSAVDKRRFAWLIAFAGCVFACDQYTKALALEHLLYQQSVPVFVPWLSWTLVYNYGAAFSFLAKAGGAQHWFFVGIASAAVLLLPIWMRRLHAQQRLLAIALALIWSGALGNLVDRLRFRYVVDFIHVHWKDVWHYPVFNIADSAITIGAVLLIIYELFYAKKFNQSNTQQSS
jgi:signal peptidase II